MYKQQQHQEGISSCSRGRVVQAKHRTKAFMFLCKDVHARGVTMPCTHSLTPPVGVAWVSVAGGVLLLPPQQHSCGAAGRMTPCSLNKAQHGGDPPLLLLRARAAVVDVAAAVGSCLRPAVECL